MIKTLAMAAALVLTSAAVAAGSAPVPLDVGCKTDEDMQTYRTCTAGCKKRSDAAQKTCNKTYKACRDKCSGDDKRTCRRECRKAYRSCSSKQRDGLKKCRTDCVKSSGCEEIPE